jgi:hypothetical protein
MRGRKFTPRARIINPKRYTADQLALMHAAQLQANAPQNSNMSATWSEVIFNNVSDYTAVASTASEASLLAGVNEQPIIPGGFFIQPNNVRRMISLVARGVLSTTGTPTIIFQARMGTTSGSATLSGTSVGVSAAITTASGITNKYFELRLDLTCRTPGIGTGNMTLFGAGYVKSPGGFASPFEYAIEPTTPDTATWTSTFDGSLAQYINLSVTWSASSASNTITLKQFYVLGTN